MKRLTNTITGEEYGEPVHQLFDLKSFDDFQVTEWRGDGITHDGPDRCEEGQDAYQVFANGRTWTMQSRWIDKGRAVREKWYIPN